MKPRLLDLFCGAGGAAVGYHRAGFEVVGVDIEPQPRYPFEFHRADALAMLESVTAQARGEANAFLGWIDAVHASPPCPRYSAITRVTGRPEDHPDLVGPTRVLLRGLGLPYVIENVEGAPLRNPVRCCGAAFNLAIVDRGQRYVIRRHRLFECSFPVMVPPCACHRANGIVLGIYGGGARQDTRLRANTRGGNTQKANAQQGRDLLDMPWATRNECNQAIPPVYTEHIGHYLLAETKAARSSGRCSMADNFARSADASSPSSSLSEASS